MSCSNGNMLDRMNMLKSWSRHNTYQTPKSMKDVWSTSYSNSYNGKKIGFFPDRTIVDYFSGNRQHIIPSRQSQKSAYYKTQFNERAREGFRYWMIEKPRPSHFGKYGTGTYKTVLGIGNAPRT